MLQRVLLGLILISVHAQASQNMCAYLFAMKSVTKLTEIESLYTKYAGAEGLSKVMLEDRLNKSIQKYAQENRIPESEILSLLFKDRTNSKLEMELQKDKKEQENRRQREREDLQFNFFNIKKVSEFDSPRAMLEFVGDRVLFGKPFMSEVYNYKTHQKEYEIVGTIVNHDGRSRVAFVDGNTIKVYDMDAKKIIVDHPVAGAVAEATFLANDILALNDSTAKLTYLNMKTGHAQETQESLQFLTEIRGHGWLAKDSLDQKLIVPYHDSKQKRELHQIFPSYWNRNNNILKVDARLSRIIGRNHKNQIVEYNYNLKEVRVLAEIDPDAHIEKYTEDVRYAIYSKNGNISGAVNIVDSKNHAFEFPYLKMFYNIGDGSFVYGSGESMAMYRPDQASSVRFHKILETEINYPNSISLINSQYAVFASMEGLKIVDLQRNPESNSAIDATTFARKEEGEVLIQLSPDGQSIFAYLRNQQKWIHYKIEFPK